MRLNDYDFGQGVVPTVTYATLPQFVYGVASTASETFPQADSQPYNFLNLDVYAQDTWRVTKTFTWTFGLRATHNSNPVNPHDAVARLPGSWDAITHDVNEPLDTSIQTHLGNIFAATPVAILQPRTAIAWEVTPKTVLRVGVGVNPPYSKTFQGGLLGTAGGTGFDSAVAATVAANRTFTSGFAQGQLSCASASPNPGTCLQPVAITAVPDGKLHAPYFMQWSFAVERQIGATVNLRAQYVGTRAVNQPYQTQVNGYQTVCPGCFAPFPYGQPSDARFGAVTQLSTGANSHYDGLQLTADKRLAHGLQAVVNYTWSHCMDTVSNGGFLPFSAGGILTPLPGELGRQYGPCDYDIRDNLTVQYVYQLPVKVRNKTLGAALNGWQVSGTAFWHSGVPFSVFSMPYSSNGDGIVQGSGPQYASVVAGVPVYARRPITGVTPAGTVQWLNPDAFFSAVDPSTGACAGGDSPQNCQFGNLGRNALRGPDFVWGDFCLTRWFGLRDHAKLRVDAQAFNVLNHPNFALPAAVYAGIPARPSTQTGFGALTYTTAPPTGLLGVGLGGDSSPRMIAFQARLEF